MCRIEDKIERKPCSAVCALCLSDNIITINYIYTYTNCYHCTKTAIHCITPLNKKKTHL